MEQSPVRLYDIAANLTDQQFGDVDDLAQRQEVVQRALSANCTHLLIACGSHADVPHARRLCEAFPNSAMTVGIHPCQASSELAKRPVEENVRLLVQSLSESGAKAVAVGECGLDYDRLNYSSKEDQLRMFAPHFDLAQQFGLPMYLHNRNTGEDFFDVVQAHRHKFCAGVVHSFTGSQHELERVLQLGLMVGVNGCSLKTEDNLEVVRHIPLERLLLETDAPYCGLKKKHAGHRYVDALVPTSRKKQAGVVFRDRNEPCRIVEVLEVVSKLLRLPAAHVAEQAFRNSLALFHPARAPSLA